MTFDIQITPGNSVPIFRQIADQVRLAAATGLLPPGHQLPSVRALAERLVVNPNTVARAYADLSREGIIDCQQGRGVFIAKPRQVYTRAERQRRLEPALDALAREALALGFAPDEIHEAIDKKLSQLDVTPRTKGGTRL